MDSLVLGLSTQQALQHLHDDLQQVLAEKDWTGAQGWDWVKRNLNPSYPQNALSWPSLVAVLITAAALIIASALDEVGAGPSIFDAVIILFLLTICLFSVLWEDKLRKEETFNKASSLVNHLYTLKDSVTWTEDDYPHITSPPSPCITLQWTYRDGHVVNLPWALLVRGDVIVLRPGQTVPGHCTSVEGDKKGADLCRKDTYNPQTSKDATPLPAMRAPLENHLYLLKETPYASHLRLSLQEALNRPTPFNDKERHLLITICLEQIALPIIFVCVLVLNVVRYVHVYEWHAGVTWWQLLLVEPCVTVLPLLPLTLPIAWRVYTSWAMTRIRAVLQSSPPPSVGEDPFEGSDIEANTLQYGEQWRYFIEEMLGKSPVPFRSSNLVHVLGSVTALCCVDKKGILSWPNPTAEKVFFLKRSTAGAADGNSTADLNDANEQHDVFEKDPLNISGSETEVAEAEVLDLTHDNAIPFKLNFDDHSWKSHLSSLKPLGLAILLNTCNAQSHEVYSQFCYHLSCEAAQDESLVPVTNRRCLCELAAQIGFMDQAQEAFVLEQILCTFQHVKAETVKRDIKLARHLCKNTRLKFPFPHMVGTMLRDKQTGCLQLMTQGTADVILDSCVEYWDGHDLHPLTPQDRKKILDFYQRTSLTAHCTAFAYRPLSKMLNPALANMYLEIPSDSRHLYLPFRSPTPLALSLFDAKWRGVLAQFHSSDSLLGIDGKEEEVTELDGWFELQCNQIFIGMVTMQYQAQPDVVQLVEQLESACIRFVHFSKENELRSRVFSEKIGLESGWNCHVSLLSDKRTEPPTSCEQSKAELCADLPPGGHKSPTSQMASPAVDLTTIHERSNLLNSRGMSFSAPSAINTELNTVKFDEAALNWKVDEPVPTALSHRERRISEDSVIGSADADGWKSLSCLTESSDQSEAFPLYISNRAKLPRGIEQIRPHLEMIDNVPLLVSLFTDCTPSVTSQMIHIMQDYGEVVVVIGSSANADNVTVFLQADASIAMEPLYPQVCHKQGVPPRDLDCPTVQLSRALNSLPCALSMRRHDSVSMYQLIAWARHYCLSLRNCLQFWLCCVASLSAVLVLSSVLMIPPPLNSGQIVLLCYILVPILSSTLMTTPMDQHIMDTATGKNQCTIHAEVIRFVCWCYGLKCLPSVVLVCLVQVAGLAVYSQEMARATNSTATVSILYPAAVHCDAVPWPGWNHYPASILYLQHCCSLLFLLHWIVTSASFVDRNKQLWRCSIIEHYTWLAACVITLCIQGCYSMAALTMTSVRDADNQLKNVEFPWYVVVPALASPVLVLAIDEAVKRQEIKVNKRFQSRKRLDFGTKLGMNSPF